MHEATPKTPASDADGRFLLLETKTAQMEDGIDPEARRKAEALLAYPEWAAERLAAEPLEGDVSGIVAGVVYNTPTGWMLAGVSRDADIHLEPLLF